MTKKNKCRKDCKYYPCLTPFDDCNRFEPKECEWNDSNCPYECIENKELTQEDIHKFNRQLIEAKEKPKECGCLCHTSDEPLGHDSLCCEFPNKKHEPKEKPKVKRWLWAFCEHGNWRVSKDFYEIFITDLPCIKLEWSEIETDE